MAKRDPLADPGPLIRRVYAFVAFHMGPGPAAEDVTSDVFERALRYRDSFDPSKGTPLSWLLGIARRSLASAKLTPVRTETATEELGDPGDLEAETLRRIDLSRALETLEDRERELVALRYGAGLSSKEIGALLDLRANAVDVALHRARERLKSALGDVSDEQRATPAPGPAAAARTRT